MEEKELYVLRLFNEKADKLSRSRFSEYKRTKLKIHETLSFSIRLEKNKDIEMIENLPINMRSMSSF